MSAGLEADTLVKALEKQRNQGQLPQLSSSLADKFTNKRKRGYVTGYEIGQVYLFIYGFSEIIWKTFQKYDEVIHPTTIDVFVRRL